MLLYTLSLLSITLTPSPAPKPPPGQHFTLTDGQFFVPEGFRPEPDGGFVLTLHLHGAAWAAECNLVAAKHRGVLVTVVLPGLSRVYAQKFQDRAVFPRVLTEVQQCLAGLFPGSPLHVKRLVVTSFSAGFGGVRELLKDPAAFARIDALVMADSLHAGYVGDPAARQVNRGQMEGFLRFAREALAGRKCLLLSHSEIRPPGYASTTETADYLLRAVDGTREAVNEEWPGGLRLRSRFCWGRLEVYGFAGETGADHMQHLHQLWTLLERVRPDGSAADRCDFPKL